MARNFHHERMAIDARIHLFAIAVLRMFHHGEMHIGDVFNDELDAQLIRRAARVGRAEKRRGKRESRHLDALLLKDSDREQAVQAAGEKHERFHFFILTHYLEPFFILSF